MPPKRREKETDSSKPVRADASRTDHELFLQAFEKPTQIYRFLRSRTMLCPTFLYRNLTYMRSRMSRSNKSRKNFRVDSLLARAEKPQHSLRQPLSGYLTLTFIGVYDMKGGLNEDPVKVETLLIQICHKKRKDVSSPEQKTSYGISYVAYNPSEHSTLLKVPTVSIPLEAFSVNDDTKAKSYYLILRAGTQSEMISDVTSGEPPNKKRKSLKAEGDDTTSWYQYSTDLIIYDKQNRCLLVDGDYELVLDEITPGTEISHSRYFWDCLDPIKEDDQMLSSFQKLRSGPTIKLDLKWSTDPLPKFVDRPKPITMSVDDTTDSNSNKENDRPGEKKKSEKKLKLVYQFLYNNNSRQQTEASDDLHCPWCSLDCSNLYSLLKHLKLCHSRFSFTYVPIPGGARVDVAINDYYDGSYSGSPQDLIAQPPGMAFSRNGPVRRTCVSYILVCYPKRPLPSLSEFLELDENEYDGQRPFITGHNRLYHHTTTCLPIYPKEMDIDSEDENDPKWLQTKTMMMIDDFTDVNEGEKELMKMWNLHVMRHGYVGDCQIPLACTMFLQAKGHELLKKNLYRNYVLHVCNLFDFGLISPVTVYTTIHRLQELIQISGDGCKVLQDSCKKQRQHWVTEGASKALEPRRLASPSQGPAERRKPSNSYQVQSKGDKRAAPVSTPENVSKKRTSEQLPPSSSAPAVKKKLSLNGVGNSNNGKSTAASYGEKDKKKVVDKSDKEKDKGEIVLKKRALSNGIPVISKVVPQSKEKDTSELKLRRKSSSVTTAEPTNPVVMLRRKSFTGATDMLRRKSTENGPNNSLPSSSNVKLKL